MGQIDKYVDRTSELPPVVLRIFQLVMPVVMVARAIVTHTFENILWAVVFVVLMLPTGIAPKTAHSRWPVWEREHPFLSGVLSYFLMSCSAFLLLRWVLDRTPSAVIALALPLIVLPIGHWFRRRRDNRADA